MRKINRSFLTIGMAYMVLLSLELQLSSTESSNAVFEVIQPAKAGTLAIFFAENESSNLNDEANARGIPCVLRKASNQQNRFEILESPITWVKQGHSFVLRARDQASWLHYVAKPSDNLPASLDKRFHHEAYFHPIRTPQGKIVTDDYPEDHPWQRGLWMAWTKLIFEGNEYDFWNQGAKEIVTAKVISKTVKIGSTPNELLTEHEFLIFESDEEKGSPILTDQWNVQAYQFGNANVLDLISIQKNVSKSVIRFPKHHYGGLGFRTRLAENTAAIFLTSEGLDRTKGNLQPARWLWVGDAPTGAGALVLIHPSNFRFPQPLRLNPQQVQISIAPSILGDWSLQPAQELKSRYRFIFLDSMPVRDEIENLWEDFARPPRLKFLHNSPK